MKRLICAVVVFAVGCGPAAETTDSGLGSAVDAADPGAAALVVATVNLRCLLDDWNLRRGLLAGELAEVDPDVIAFQEVCHGDDGADNLDELLVSLSAATGRSYQAARAVTHRSWDLYDEGIALVTHQPMDGTREVALPPGVFERKAMIARIAPPVGDVWIAATHLSFGDQASIRRAQLGAIRDVLATTTTGAALIMGDCNAAPDEAALTDAIGAGYVDTWAAANPSDPGYTFPASAPEVRIDHILLGSPGSITTAAARLFMDNATDGVMPSDHLGVTARLQATP